MSTAIIILGAIVGACIGSFAGCAFYRVPRGMSLTEPRSHCPACNHVLHWYENIPVISFIIQKGRVRCCGIPLRASYLLNEIIFALIGAAAAYYLLP